VVTIRYADEIILNLIDFYRSRQPNLDVKPGTVARDLFIESPAGQLSLLYDEISKISDQQSIRLVSGSDLDFLSQNFGVSRKSSTTSSGVALLTFASIPATIGVGRGSLVFSSSGISFATQTGISINPSQSNLYKAVATRYRNELDFLGISDLYAVEVPVIATTPGIIGNISKFGISRTNIAGISNVTNINPFSGGANQEDDTSFRNRVLAIFSGSNVGTALGYRNLVLSDTDVLDALVIEPGDSLMIRDGTQVFQNDDGSFTIISEGQGGKVDIIILGTRLAEQVDSFIYRDASNRGDPTDIKNNFVLGQIVGDENKTVNRKRIDNIAAKTLPAQPAQQIVEVTGSLSGSNFKEKTIDSLGRVQGNYELIKDTGVYSGSPWGFDKFVWISDKISDLPEDRVKGKYNGQDNVTFTDVLTIPALQQNLLITNENSTVLTTDRSVITLLHTPCTGVTRVFNVTTGERYTVTNQNLNGTGTINTLGRIQISGNTLPSPSDILQVDYTWIVQYDPYVDYDGRFTRTNPRTVQDSVDWGFSNAVRDESVVFTKNTSGTFYSGTAIHPITSVISVNAFSSGTSTVTVATSGVYLGKLVVILTGLLMPLETVSSVKIFNTSKELYQTSQNDGSVQSTKVVTGFGIFYDVTVVLPTDTSAQAGQTVQVTYGVQDIFIVNGLTGNLNNNLITIPVQNYPSGPNVFTAKVNYIAEISDLFSFRLNELPAIRKGNGYDHNQVTVRNRSNPACLIESQHAKIALSSGGQYYLKLDLSSAEYELIASNVVSAAKLDGTELWNGAGTVSTDTDLNYILNLSQVGLTVDESVMVTYQVRDLSRFQPSTFACNVISKEIADVTLAPSGKFILTGLTIPSNIDLNQIFVMNLADASELSDPNITVVGNILTFSDAVQETLIGNEKVLVVYFSTASLKQSVTRLAVSLSDQINNEGVVTFTGTTITKAKDIIFTINDSGLVQDLGEALRTALSLTSNDTLSSRYGIIRVVKMERVEVIGAEVTDVLTSYDVLGNQLRTALYYSNESITDQTLGGLKVRLPATTNNLNNLPNIGDKVRVTFYYMDPNDHEDLFFTRNGTVYGNKYFAQINKVAVSSGFTTISNALLTVSQTNQPAINSRYLITYNYTAPKLNERILVRYNYNRLIGDTTLTLETNRPINSDVLIKQASEIKINVTLAIVLKSEFNNAGTTVTQNVRDRLIVAINTNKLNDILDASDMVNVAGAVDGVDRVRVTAFNQEGKTGQVLSITAQRNQYFVANNVSVVLEGR